MRDPDPILLTGASGYVGSHLLDELLRRGRSVRALMREPAPGRLPAQVDARKSDAVAGTGLAEALDGCRTAYYLIHSMGSGSGDAAGFARRDREAAVNFGEAARDAGVERVIYLGGLGDETTSEHLRSRHEVGELLRQRVPGLVYVRAAMVIGAGSAAFETIVALVDRVPGMICPRWVSTRTQPIALADIAAYLAAVAGRGDMFGGSFDAGGPDVMTYREMIERIARIRGKRPLIVEVPVLTPRLSSYWLHLVTPVNASVARPLIEGLRNATVARDERLRQLLPLRLTSFEDAARAAMSQSLPVDT